MNKYFLFGSLLIFSLSLHAEEVDAKSSFFNCLGDHIKTTNFDELSFDEASKGAFVSCQKEFSDLTQFECKKVIKENDKMDACLVQAESQIGMQVSQEIFDNILTKNYQDAGKHKYPKLLDNDERSSLLTEVSDCVQSKSEKNNNKLSKEELTERIIAKKGSLSCKVLKKATENYCAENSFSEKSFAQCASISSDIAKGWVSDILSKIE